jgi:ribosomal protein L23
MNFTLSRAPETEKTRLLKESRIFCFFVVGNTTKTIIKSTIEKTMSVEVEKIMSSSKRIERRKSLKMVTKFYVKLKKGFELDKDDTQK